MLCELPLLRDLCRHIVSAYIPCDELDELCDIVMGLYLDTGRLTARVFAAPSNSCLEISQTIMDGVVREHCEYAEVCTNNDDDESDPVYAQVLITELRYDQGAHQHGTQYYYSVGGALMCTHEYWHGARVL